MRFVPNLIPKSSRVMSEYFIGVSKRQKNMNSGWLLASWSLGIVLCILALAMIPRFILLILFGMIGTILLPPVQSFLEEKLRFNLTTKIKSVFCLGLFIISLPFVAHYSKIDAQENTRINKLNKQRQKAQLLAKKKEDQRKNSLALYIDSAKTLSTDHHQDEALEKLSFATSIATNESEEQELAELGGAIMMSQTEDYIESGKYGKAIENLDYLLKQTPESVDLLYNLGFCHSKKRETKIAVYYLTEAMKGGSDKAKTLHEKINPIRKRISGYVTRCCDGSISYSTGRGTCSHHGGVCTWSEPEYEQYRKY